jgi:hypothetical protein
MGSTGRLRVLCLHGFRQSGRSFRGRSAALAKRLSSLVDLVFVDAPHPLPFLMKAPHNGQQQVVNEQHTSEGSRFQCKEGLAPQRPRRAWLLEPCQFAALKVKLLGDCSILLFHLRHLPEQLSIWNKLSCP